MLAELDVSKAGTALDGPYLAWTPDSKWVVSPVPEVGRRTWSLCLFSVETGEKRQLTNAATDVGGDDTAPAISPNGRLMAFARINTPLSELCLLHLEEDYKPLGEPERIPADNPYSIGAAWTPDGSDIVFSAGIRVGTRIHQPWSLAGGGGGASKGPEASVRPG